MTAKNTKTKTRFTPFVLAHRAKILPLLGDENIAEVLEGQCDDATIHEYESLHDQPQGINAQLKPHQLDGVAFLSWLRKNEAHGILADDMGLGKTLQAISFFQQINNTEHNDDRPFLVICPLSVLDSWALEVKKWTAMRAVQYHGSNEKRQMISRMVKKKEADIVIITYETVISDINRISRMARWRCVVADEGHRLKNGSTQLSGSIKKLKADQRLILTGTPIQNDLGETWSLLNWLYPEVFVDGTSAHFKEAFCLGDGKVDSVFLSYLKKFLEVIMVRRIKDSLITDLRLPPKSEVIMYLPLTELQKRLYLEILTGGYDQRDFKVDQNGNHMPVTPPQSPGFENYSSLSATQAVSQAAKRQSMTNILMELRKVCIHSFFMVGSEDVDENLDINLANLVHGSSKFIALKRLIEEEVLRNQKKILIFSGFNYALDCCESLLTSMGISSLRLDGETCYAMRNYNIHRFQNSSEYKVFIIATRAGGEGITLTAGEVVVFLDSDWNPQVTAQAEARVYRIGQFKPVTVYKLCTRGTVEEQILNRVDKKLYLASKLTDNFANANLDATQPEHIESDSVFIQHLIRQSQRSVMMSKFDANDLMDMSWANILSLCTKTPVDNEDNEHSPLSPPASPQSASFNEDEISWLSRNEKVRTSLFNGKVFSRPTAPRKSELLTDLDLINRRLNKNRTVYDKTIDYFITKESTLCKWGEAVPTLTDGTLTKVKKVSKVEFQHLKTCMFCKKTRHLEECLYCPQVYHKKCVVRQKESPRNNPFNNTICSKHSCVKCGLAATNSGGLLFSCNICPYSYCIECLNLNAIKCINGEIAEYGELGYESPRHMEHITCEGCVTKSKERNSKRSTTSSARLLRSVKRSRRFDFE